MVLLLYFVFRSFIWIGIASFGLIFGPNIRICLLSRSRSVFFGVCFHVPPYNHFHRCHFNRCVFPISVYIYTHDLYIYIKFFESKRCESPYVLHWDYHNMANQMNAKLWNAMERIECVNVEWWIFFLFLFYIHCISVCGFGKPKCIYEPERETKAKG